MVKEITCKQGYRILYFGVRIIRKNPFWGTRRYSSLKGAHVTLEELNDNSFVARLGLKPDPNIVYALQARVTPKKAGKGMRPHFSTVVEKFQLNARLERIPVTDENKVLDSSPTAGKLPQQGL